MILKVGDVIYALGYILTITEVNSTYAVGESTSYVKITIPVSGKYTMYK